MGGQALDVGSQPPMPEKARRLGLENARAILRRRHPGFDFIFEDIRDESVASSTPGQIGGPLAAPEHPGAAPHRIDVPATSLGGPHHDAVGEAA